MPGITRGMFSSKMRYDLSGVRIHDNAAATTLNRELGARASTVGRDIFFGSGQFRPDRPIQWSLTWNCPQSRTSGFTVDPGGTSGLAFSSTSGTGGRVTDNQEISTDSDKAGGQLVERGNARVLQDVHNYGYDTRLARSLHERATARGFDHRRCGYVLEQRFHATVGAFDKDANPISRCHYSFVYRAERDAVTGSISVKVRYKGADQVEGTFSETRSDTATPSRGARSG